MKKILFSAVIVLFFTSCQQNIPKEVKKVVNSTKTNKAELEKVISHYQQLNDSTKLAAAYFLIENMDGQCYSVTKIVDTAGNKVDFNVLDYPNYKTMVEGWDSLENKIGTIDFKRDTLIYDINIVTADYLIENIDLAFIAWKKPWAKHLTFTQFCEYILPYRSSNEPVERWRHQLYERYNWLEDSLLDKTNPVEACIKINNELTSWYVFDPLFYRHPTDLGLSEMFEYKKGRCEDMTNLAIYAMRSQGIPVMSDYTPAWPNTGNNHAWNATLTKDNEVVIFMGGLTNPYEYKLDNKKAKVYRKTFSKQKNSLAITAPEYESIPGWLSSSHYIDVTSEYIPVTNVTLALNNKPDSVNYAYLFVFNSGSWKAIQWGKLTADSVTFNDMGMDIAYLPAYYKNGERLPMGNSFILDTIGNILEKVADTNNTISINLYSTTKKVTKKATDEIEEASFNDGAEYELFYWNDNWISVGSKKAIAHKPLNFNNVPNNALYWLVEKGSKKDERIFTIKNNIVQWW